MSYVGLLYIFSKHEKFLFLLATIDGEVIEQLFHVSHLKKGLLLLLDSKTVKNINDYKLEMAKQANNYTKGIENNEQRATGSSQTSVKSVVHNLHNESQTISQALVNDVNWYWRTTILQNICLDRNQDILNLYHAHPCMTNLNDFLDNTVFSPVESLQEYCNSYTVTKCHFKFGNLQIFCYFSNESPNEGL